DRRYGAADIISADCFSNQEGDLGLSDWWWWRCVPNLLPPPWARSMVCAIRVSRTLLDLVGAFVPRTRDALARENAPLFPLTRLARRLKNKRAFGEFKEYPRYLFIEYVFHTLALHNGRTIVVAEELSGVHWASHDLRVMQPDWLYHPVKDRASHEAY